MKKKVRQTTLLWTDGRTEWTECPVTIYPLSPILLAEGKISVCIYIPENIIIYIFLMFMDRFYKIDIPPASRITYFSPGLKHLTSNWLTPSIRSVGRYLQNNDAASGSNDRDNLSVWISENCIWKRSQSLPLWEVFLIGCSSFSNSQQVVLSWKWHEVEVVFHLWEGFLMGCSFFSNVPC